MSIADPALFVSASAVLALSALLAAPAGAQACQPLPSGAGKECFVSPTGHDGNPGTLLQPLRSIARGIAVLQAGDVLTLRGGVYVEPIRMTGKHGTRSRPVVIRARPGERAFVDGSLPEFRTLDNDDWEPVADDPSAQGAPHADEYVSRTTVTGFIRGAFIDGARYTRLITYSTLEDLRAPNETFDAITSPDDPRPGPVVLNCDEQGANCQTAPHRYPWVYMGPGIWIERDVSTTTPRRIHIRLSPTHNRVPGIADYAGEVDPRRLRIAISTETMQTVRITASSHVRIEGLDIRFGGDVTAYVADTTGVVFDHVRFRASTYGVRTRGNTGLTFSHCEFDGGKPTWYFRNDGKREYWFATSAAPRRNILGKHTMRTLWVPSRTDVGTTVHHSEFHDAHDLYLGGDDVDFHHNWISEMNDEGLFLDAYGGANVRVHHNVILKTLSALSFANEATGGVDAVGGPFFIYRNLVDLREPTSGYRPRQPGEVAVWRYGSVSKSNGEDGPYALFQNTFLVRDQDGQASFMHFRNMHGEHVRRVFNNIFVAVHSDAATDVAITFLPSPLFPAATDGNAWYRIGSVASPPYRYLAYASPDVSGPAGVFDCLTGCDRDLIGSALFAQSMAQYTPGYEAGSIEGDPQFRQIGADGFFRPSDDLRLAASSPARAAGIALPEDLWLLDRPLTTGPMAIGCFRADSGRLRVGIDGRRIHPGS
jgi:hypothetical protein